MSRRIAPRGGYDFPEKADYREQVWSAFQRHGPVKPWNAHALLMPSTEGLEIDVALKHRFCEDQLHVVDRNPAIVATLKRTYKAVHTYGVEVESAFERVARKGVSLSFANLDLTGCVSGSLLGALREIGQSGAFAARSLVGITLLRGRETRSASDYMAALSEVNRFCGLQAVCERSYSGAYVLSETDVARLVEACDAIAGTGHHKNAAGVLCLGSFWDPVAVGSYRSTAGSQTMLWIVADFENARTAHHRSDAMYDKQQGKLRAPGLHGLSRKPQMMSPIGVRWKAAGDGNHAEWFRIQQKTYRSLVRLVGYMVRSHLLGQGATVADLAQCRDVIRADGGQFQETCDRAGLTTWIDELIGPSPCKPNGATA